MSTDKLIILGKEIKRGEGALLEMEVAKLHTRNSIKITIIVERGKLPGPTLLLLGGVHGDEINGVAIVREIIRKKYNRPAAGTIICIPAFNVFGYLNLSREFPDGRDLNRMFPGSANGSLASQFANRFTREIAPKVDYVLDFHTGGAGKDNYPNIRCILDQENELEIARAFAPPFIVNSSYIPKSLRYTIHKMGKTGILFEGGKSNSIDRNVIEHGVTGTLNVMKYLGLQPGKPTHLCETIEIAKSRWIRAPYSGLFEYNVENGSWVTQKTVLGRIYDPYGEFERRLVATSDCYIYGINTSPIVHKGDALFHVSVAKKQDRVQ